MINNQKLKRPYRLNLRFKNDQLLNRFYEGYELMTIKNAGGVYSLNEYINQLLEFSLNLFLAKNQNGLIAEVIEPLLENNEKIYEKIIRQGKILNNLNLSINKLINCKEFKSNIASEKDNSNNQNNLEIKKRLFDQAKLMNDNK
ncbi:hypothetical protein [[Mycoplasma] cavipharyngis]|uniref:hypothetical protein n=1 Tax=[Mycoplasma] cavipharyngis TaxID=92757 RepID=UPI003703A9FF